MVVVELGAVEDAAEREEYLSFLAENDIAFVRSHDGNSYAADVALVDDDIEDDADAGEYDERFAARRMFEDDDDLDDDEEEAASSLRLRAQKLMREQHQVPGRKGVAAASAGARSSVTGESLSGSRPIVSGARPSQETRRMLRAFRKAAENEDFATYSKFCSLIEMRDRLEPRPRSLKWLTGLINDVYDDRAATRSKYDLEELRVFPVFVMDHLGKRYGLRQIIDQVAWDLVLSVHTHRRHRIEVEVFARFLEEYYDAEDVRFFIRVRAIVDSIVQRSVRAAWSKDTASQRSISSTRSDLHVYLKWNEVEAVAKHLFGSSGSAERQESFLALVDENAMPLSAAGSDLGLAGTSSAAAAAAAGDAGDASFPLVEVAQLLHLAVAQNHDIRAQSMSTDVQEARRRDEAMQDVFGSAQSAYHDKLRELGFAASVAQDQLSRDLHRQHRLDEMCHAIKHALLENEATRDSLPDVSEATIREWASGLLARELAAGPKRTLKPQTSSEDSRYTRREERAREKSPPPPSSPRPPPPPYEEDEDLDEAIMAKSSSSDYASTYAYDLSSFRNYSGSPASSVSKFAPAGSRTAADFEKSLNDYGSSSRPSISSVPALRTVSDVVPSEQPPGRAPPGSPDRHNRQQQAPASPRVPLSPPPPPPPAAQGATPSPSARSEPGWLASRAGPGAHAAQQNPHQHRHADAQNVMREIHAKLDRAKQAYLASLMSSARDLPQTVLYEIEEEVRAQLDQKSRQILNDIVLGRRGASPNAGEEPDILQRHSYEQLVAAYKHILRSQRASDGSYLHLSRQVEELCEGILHSAELRQEIEPLVALLSTYANARLGSNRPRYM